MKTKAVKTKAIYRFHDGVLTAVDAPESEESKQAGIGATHLEVKSENGIPKEARIIKAKKAPTPPAV